MNLVTNELACFPLHSIRRQLPHLRGRYMVAEMGCGWIAVLVIVVVTLLHVQNVGCAAFPSVQFRAIVPAEAVLGIVFVKLINFVVVAVIVVGR